MKRTTPPKPPQRAGLRGAFRTNKRPLPWSRAIGSGLCLGTPILVSILFGRLSYGLVACFGGFTYLYASTESYPKRAIKLLIVMIGLALSLGATAYGAAHSLWAAAIMLGAVGAGAFFICEVLGVGEPAAFFFIFAASVGTSMPGGPSAILLRMGLVLLGGIPSWLLAMSGWLWDPHEPETKAVGEGYRALASLLAAVGTEGLLAVQHTTTLALRSAESVLSTTAVPRRRPGAYLRLLRLHEQADAIFLAIIELASEREVPVDPTLPAAVRALADAVEDPDRAASLIIPEPAEQSHALANLSRTLSVALTTAKDDSATPRFEIQPKRGTIRAALNGVVNRRSAVLPKTLRIGFMLIIAHLIASTLGARSPYWVDLSCGAVMLGPTVVATLHRAIQRSIGTIFGAILGALILALHPSGIWIAFALMAVQVLVQLTIKRNYALAIAFATPLAFVIAEAGHPNLGVYYLVTARLTDIILGSALGFVGTLLLAGRYASRRLPVVLGEAIRAEGALAAALTDQGSEDRSSRNRLQTALITLRIVYDGALHELGKDRSRVEALWPAVVATHRLGLHLIALSDHKRHQAIATEGLGQLDGLFDTLADAVMQGEPPRLDRLPVLPAYPAISDELHVLVEGLQVLHLTPVAIGQLPS